MKIKSVEINNILSIESAKVEFGDSGLVLLDGWNYDDNTANGAGKTSIFNAISFALFGKLPRKISISDILRSGTKIGWAKVKLESNGSIYEVIRYRPNNLKFFKDGVEVTKTQDEFELDIRLNYNQFLISMYSAQTEGLKLIHLNDSSKKDFFLQLMSLDRLSTAKEEADNRLKAIRAEIAINNNQELEISSKIEAHSESLIEEEEALSKIKELDPSDLVKKLNKLSNIKKPDVSKYSELEQKLREHANILYNEEVENRLKRKEYDLLKSQLDRIIDPTFDTACPKCNAKICVDDGHVLTLEHVIQEVEDKRNKIKSQMSTLVEEINSAADYEVERKKIKEKIQKCIDKRENELSEYSETIDKIEELKTKINNRNNAISTLQNSLSQNKLLQDKIDKLNLKLKVITEKELELKNKELILEAASIALGPSGAPAYVMDSAINVFNELISDYVSMIWPNASYALQSYKTNKSGDIKAKFSETLVINGKDTAIGSLSGGEFRCLSLALDFAVIGVLESMFGIKLNPIMLDEPFNDLDAANRERVIELLNKLSIDRQILIIDHATEAKTMFSNTIRVEKRNGISSVVI